MMQKLILFIFLIFSYASFSQEIKQTEEEARSIFEHLSKDKYKTSKADEEKYYFSEESEVIKYGSRFAKYISGDKFNILIYQKVVYDDKNQKSGTTTIEYQIKNKNGEFSNPKEIDKSVSFKFQLLPRIYSAIQTKDGDIYLVLENAKELYFYKLNQDKMEFELINKKTFNQDLINFDIYNKKDGFIILGELNLISNFDIVYLDSKDFKDWSDFKKITDEPGKKFNPKYFEFEDQEYIVFQIEGKKDVYNIGLSKFDKKNNSLEKMLILTKPENNFEDNQDPYLFKYKNEMYMVWDRGTKDKKDIFLANVNVNQMQLENITRISNENNGATNPHAFEDINGKLLISYIESPYLNSAIALAQITQNKWQTQILTKKDKSAGSQSQGISKSNEIELYFHARENQEVESKIYKIGPDLSSTPPFLSLVFPLSKRSMKNRIILSLKSSNDSSGIKGFIYSVNKNGYEFPKIDSFTEGEAFDLKIEGLLEGDYYITVSQLDNAGNISYPSYFKYTMDITPPKEVEIFEPEKDKDGFVISNNIKLFWSSNLGEKDFAKYIYFFKKIGDNNPKNQKKGESYIGILNSETTSNFIIDKNIPDGTYVLGVIAEDSSGNRTKLAKKTFKFDKYIPNITVTSVSIKRKLIENSQVVLLNGTDFVEKTNVISLIVDKDGAYPYDYEINLSPKDIKNNKSTNWIKTNIDKSGDYYFGIKYNNNRTAFLDSKISFKAYGSLKEIIKEEMIKKYYKIAIKYVISNSVVIALALIVVLILLILNLIKIKLMQLDDIEINDSFEGFKKGNSFLSYIIERNANMKNGEVSFSLRLKFSVFTIMLVTIVILLISMPLQAYFVNLKKKDVKLNLENQIKVFADSVISQSKEYLLDLTNFNNQFNLLNIPFLTESSKEIMFLTLTSNGEDFGDKNNYNHIWASNDPIITNIYTEDKELFESTKNIYKREVDGEFTPGESIIKDDYSASLTEIASQVNKDMNLRFVTEYEKLDEIALQISKIASKDALNDSEKLKLNRLEQNRIGIERDIEREIRKIYVPHTMEKMDFDHLKDFYVYVEPIVFKKSGKDNNYFKGFMRIGVTTKEIKMDIINLEKHIFFTIILISSLTFIIGIIGSLILSRVITEPIKKIVNAVLTIKNTENKKDLYGFNIEIKSKDELKVLGNEINNMTLGLVKAAQENEQVIMGKDVQKKFIPLHVFENGQKDSSGSFYNEYSEIYGYYEGAKGISGDYYYHQKIDDDHHTAIKCDISGKGISAGILMVEVATLFLDYFRNWSTKFETLKNKKDPYKGVLKTLVENINDLISERGFNARFAAFTLLLFNEKNGKCKICNAGDTLLNIYRSELGEIETIKLRKSPPAGMFSSQDSFYKPNFVEEDLELGKEDFFLLYTDGLEESMRFLRDKNFKILTKEEVGKHGEKNLVELKEEFGNDRVFNIVKSIMKNEKYVLKRELDPLNEKLEFDFSKIESSIENIVLGLVGIEKIFRQIRRKDVDAQDIISIDKKVENLLKKTFKNYLKYFAVKKENEHGEQQYDKFSYMKEESQYDDLTILVIKKK